MSLPKRTKVPSYMRTDLNELTHYFKNSLVPIEKSSSPRKSPKAKSPIIKDPMKHASILLAPINNCSHKKHDYRYPKALPQITKLGGKKRTRKNKSNRRRTLRKK